jgi:GNAT acetyltransferase-like protein
VPALPVPELRDGVVALRPWRESGVPAKFAAFSDPVVHRFSHARVEPYTEADALANVILARWAFDDLGLAQLQITCGPDNLASQRVAERAGFVREGVLRSHLPFKGGRRDTVVFSRLPGG